MMGLLKRWFILFESRFCTASVSKYELSTCLKLQHIVLITYWWEQRKQWVRRGLRLCPIRRCLVRASSVSHCALAVGYIQVHMYVVKLIKHQCASIQTNNCRVDSLVYISWSIHNCAFELHLIFECNEIVELQQLIYTYWNSMLSFKLQGLSSLRMHS